jgi:hypothetical protein
MTTGRGGGGILQRLHIPLLAVWCASTAGWLIVVADNYIIHNPYGLGRSCVSCYNYVYYVYDLAYRVAYPGLVAAAFFAVSLLCLLLLWAPRLGPTRAFLRTALLVAPALVFLFEVGVYIWLGYAWMIHATDFLIGTPFTNEEVFWLSGGVLVLGVAAELAGRRQAPSAASSPSSAGVSGESSAA